MPLIALVPVPVSAPPGDVMPIPAKVRHQMIRAPGATLT